MENYTTSAILDEIAIKKPEELTTADIQESKKTIITSDAYALAEAIENLTNFLRQFK